MKTNTELEKLEEILGKALDPDLALIWKELALEDQEDDYEYRYLCDGVLIAPDGKFKEE